MSRYCRRTLGETLDSVGDCLVMLRNVGDVELVSGDMLGGGGCGVGVEIGVEG